MLELEFRLRPGAEFGVTRAHCPVLDRGGLDRQPEQRRDRDVSGPVMKRGDATFRGPNIEHTSSDRRDLDADQVWAIEGR